MPVGWWNGRPWNASCEVCGSRNAPFLIDFCARRENKNAMAFCADHFWPIHDFMLGQCQVTRDSTPKLPPPKEQNAQGDLFG